MDANIKKLETIILLAKKHKVDVIKMDGIEVIVTRHDHDLRDGAVADTNSQDKVKIEGIELTDEEILFHSAEIE